LAHFPPSLDVGGRRHDTPAEALDRQITALGGGAQGRRFHQTTKANFSRFVQ
jgi:hypothetical protein